MRDLQFASRHGARPVQGIYDRPAVPDPTTLLSKLVPGEEVAAGSVRGLAAAADGLASAGLIAVRKDGRRTLVRLTEAGVAARPAKLEKLARAKVAKKPTSADLVARIEALEARVARLEAPVVVDLAAVKTAVLDEVAELDRRDRLGGLVPIPDLRTALRGRGIADDGAVTAALEQLEQEWRIDLNVAQAPTQVADRAAGIERPGRGLLYYVSRRSP